MGNGHKLSQQSTLNSLLGRIGDSGSDSAHDYGPAHGTQLQTRGAVNSAHSTRDRISDTIGIRRRRTQTHTRNTPEALLTHNRRAPLLLLLLHHYIDRYHDHYYYNYNYRYHYH